MRGKGRNQGFTLVEIMVVVVIIGLLASIAVPAYLRSHTSSQAAAVANNFRNYSSVFQIYATEAGSWPADVSQGVTPPELVGQLPRFSDVTAVGGYWDWDPGASGYTAAISVVNATAGVDVLNKIDEILDDGNPASGQILVAGGRVTYILEP